MARHPQGVESPELVAFQRRERSFLRAGIALMGAFLIAAVAGVFGDGPISWRTLETRSGDRIEIERFARHGNETELAIVPAGPTAELRLSLSAEFLHDVVITRLVPEPRQSELGGSAIVYTYALAPRAEAERLQIFYQPRSSGPLRGTLTVDGEKIALQQFVFP